MSPAAPSLEELDELAERIRLAPVALIGARIRRARRESGLSHDKLGALCGGTTRAHLISLEKAKHRPRVETLLRIAKATEREPEWFVTPEQDPSPFPHPAD